MSNVFLLNNVYEQLPTTTAAEIRHNSAECGFCEVKDGCISG